MTPGSSTLIVSIPNYVPAGYWTHVPLGALIKELVRQLLDTMVLAGFFQSLLWFKVSGVLICEGLHSNWLAPVAWENETP